MILSRIFVLGCAILTLSQTSLATSDRPLVGYSAVKQYREGDEFRRASSTTGLITVTDVNFQELTCTGIVLSPSVVLTARHCLFYKDEASGEFEELEITSISITLDRLDLHSGKVYDLDKDDVEKSDDDDLDFLVLKPLNQIDLNGRVVPIVAALPPASSSLLIFHFPSGHPLQVSGQDCRIANKVMRKNEIPHTCATEWGSSGAPIFDTRFRLVGIHFQNGESKNFSKAPALGLSIDAIAAENEHVRKALASYATALDQASRPISSQVSVKFDIQGDQSIFMDTVGWHLEVKKNDQIIKLLEQRHGPDNYVFWDPGRDDLYSVPIHGGMAKIKRRDSSGWADLGPATRTI